jgi:phytoene dehydrogenase-like protein
LSGSVPGSANRYDVIVVGGGHNGLVAAAYLGAAGLRVLALEARDRLGGPCGTYEFLPGYRASFANSPGSLEPRIVAELDLAGAGLRFVRPDLTVVHHFADRCFIGWRDRERVDAQFDAMQAGEAARYHALLASLDRLAQGLGVSVFQPPPCLARIGRQVAGTALEPAFRQVFHGTLRDLLDDALRADQSKAILGMIALAANLTPPSVPGTAMGLLLRPLSLASTPAGGDDDPRRMPLRGSTGLPVGGMGAIVDALAARCRRSGVALHTASPVAQVLQRRGAVQGVVTADGTEYTAPLVVSAINPTLLFRDLLDDAAVDADIRRDIAGAPMRGSAFKVVLALDGLPRYAGLPDDATAEQVVGTQFRICPSLDYLETSILDGHRGQPSAGPIMWGLFPTVTSPELAPAGKHILSVNVWHAPHKLRDGDWEQETAVFGRRCIEVLSQLMPDLPERIVDHRFMSPVEIEAELNLVGANITHGDMLPGQLFGTRPHAAMSGYRTPLRGLYLTGAGTWPGGYVTGIPGRNVSQTVLADLRAAPPPLHPQPMYDAAH